MLAWLLKDNSEGRLLSNSLWSFHVLFIFFVGLVLSLATTALYYCFVLFPYVTDWFCCRVLLFYNISFYYFLVLFLFIIAL
jgi:hypothetical protein